MRRPTRIFDVCDVVVCYEGSGGVGYVSQGYEDAAGCEERLRHGCFDGGKGDNGL